MLYKFVRLLIKTFLFFFYKKQFVNSNNLLHQKGPLLIVTNHPNAFIDAIIIGTLFKKPIHFLTRGDAFKKKSIANFLGKLNMIPIYRIRDGKENLALNDFAFNKSKQVLKQNGIVMIFIEGICKHTHQLQPLKKGAARIAFNCWHEEMSLKVLPVTIQYSSLFTMPMNIKIDIGSLLSMQDLCDDKIDVAKNYNRFNSIIEKQLQQLLLLSQQQESIFKKTTSAFGFLKYLCFPLLFFIEKWVYKKTKTNVFYHTFLFAAIVISFPLYLILLFFILIFFHFNYGFILLLLLSVVLLYLLSIKK